MDLNEILLYHLLGQISCESSKSEILSCSFVFNCGQVHTDEHACLCQRGENRASVLTVFENTHILSLAGTSYFTSLGWGVGHVNVHVNLRHMHILRYVTGLGGWGMLTCVMLTI